MIQPNALTRVQREREIAHHHEEERNDRRQFRKTMETIHRINSRIYQISDRMWNNFHWVLDRPNRFEAAAHQFDMSCDANLEAGNHRDIEELVNDLTWEWGIARKLQNGIKFHMNKRKELEDAR